MKTKTLLLPLFLILLVGLVIAINYNSIGCWTDDGCSYNIMEGGDPAINGSNASDSDTMADYGWVINPVSGQANYTANMVANGTTGILVRRGPADVTVYHDLDPAINYPVTWEVYIYDYNDVDLEMQFALTKPTVGGATIRRTNTWALIINTTNGEIHLADSDTYSNEWVKWLIEFSPGNYFHLQFQNGTWKNSSTDITVLNRTLLVAVGANHNITMDSFLMWNGTADNRPVVPLQYGQIHSYNNQSIENVNTQINLTLNLTGTEFDNSDVDIVLLYNNTKYSTTSEIGTDVITYITTVITPVITGLTDTIGFHWEYNISTYVLNSTNQTQTISNFLLTECGGSYNIHSLNISILNESDPTEGILATSLRQTYQIFDSAGTTYLSFNFSNTTTPLSNFSLCIFPNTTVTSDFQIEYVYDNIFFSYWGYQIDLSNATKTLDLYVTDGTSQITYEVKDTFDNEVEDIFITVEKYDVGTNTYKVVELLKTDSEGTAVGRAVLYTAWYRFTLKYNGVTVLVEDSTKLTDTTKEFTVNLLGADWFDKYDDFRDINYNLYWNNDTKNFGLWWDDPSLKLQKICLRVENITNTGNSIIDGADSCSTAQTGTILVNVGGSIDNQMFIATAIAYVTGSAENMFILATQEISNFLEWRFYEEGSTGIGTFVAFILVLSLFFIGIWHPAISIILGLLGVLITRILGLYYMSWGMFMALVAIGAIVIYRMSKAK